MKPHMAHPHAHPTVHTVKVSGGASNTNAEGAIHIMRVAIAAGAVVLTIVLLLCGLLAKCGVLPFPCRRRGERVPAAAPAEETPPEETPPETACAAPKGVRRARRKPEKSIKLLKDHSRRDQRWIDVAQCGMQMHPCGQFTPQYPPQPTWGGGDADPTAHRNCQYSSSGWQRQH